MKRKYNQRLEGRITSATTEKQRHISLLKQIEIIIARARDSTLMDTEYDACLIEALFRCEPITIDLPDNDWDENDHRGVNHERWFAVSLYIERAKARLERQGLGLTPTL